MQRDHMLGWPGLLPLIDTEPRPEHRTPERVRVVPQFVADSRAMHSDNPPREAKPAQPVDPVEAALRERFNIGDRIRVVGYMRPGSLPYGDGDEGVVVGFNSYYVKCLMDRNRAPDGSCPTTHWGTEDRPGGCIEVIRQPEKPAQAEPQHAANGLTHTDANGCTHSDADGWIEWTPPAGVAHPTPPARGNVMVQFRNGTTTYARGIVTWGHSGICSSDYEVVRYRVVPA